MLTHIGELPIMSLDFYALKQPKILIIQELGCTLWTFVTFHTTTPHAHASPVHCMSWIHVSLVGYLTLKKFIIGGDEASLVLTGLSEISDLTSHGTHIIRISIRTCVHIYFAELIIKIYLRLTHDQFPLIHMSYWTVNTRVLSFS